MEPLASKMRPRSLDDFVGQKHLVGEGKPLCVALEKKHPFSFILWGPPGSGKTTFARLYAQAIGIPLTELSAVSAGKDAVRTLVSSESSETKLLFLDEIHRFNRSQQDFLLPVVESGKLILIGATTENPSFEVIAPLLSRCRVFTFTPLADDEIKTVLEKTSVKIPPDALSWIVAYAKGDARRALGILESTQSLYSDISVETLTKASESSPVHYDKKGEEHYNITSAFIKSLRASQGDTALYYLARMIEAGEDPLFIARRMVIFASEDIGLAQPTALVVANAVFRACETVGYPECTLNLAHGAAYLARAPKDRSAHDALRAAQKDVRTYGALPVPLKIRNPSTPLMRDEGYGKDYEKYDKESYLPHKIKNHKYLK